MKKIRDIGIVLCAMCMAATGCSDGRPVSSREALGLKGAVRSVTVTAYEAVAADGRVERGALVEDPRTNRSYRFDRDGNTVHAEYYLGGMLVGWDDYTYGPDGRTDSIVCRSVYFGGDRTVGFAWGDGENHVRRTYDEQGRLVAEERFERRGNRSRNVCVFDGGDTVVFVTRYRGRLPVRQERRSEAYDTVLEYTYDRDGNPTEITDCTDGAMTGATRLEYTAFDGEGNWTSRVVYGADGSGAAVPRRVEERTITYY